jgi:hypothetical protein
LENNITMGQQILLSEEEKRNIQEMYGLINEQGSDKNWEGKYSCVANYEGAKKQRNSDGSHRYHIGNIKFFNNGRKTEVINNQNVTTNYSCEDEMFKSKKPVPNKPETKTTSSGSSGGSTLPENWKSKVGNGTWIITVGTHKYESKYPGAIDAVKFVQNKVGAEPDGKFGPNTKAKVKEWQSKNGLKSDGVVGKNTLSKMLS